MRGRPLARVLGASALLLICYYVLPVEGGDSAGRLALRTASAVVCVLGAAILIVRQVRRQLDPTRETSALAGLAVALVAALLAFAMADYLIAWSDPSEFDGLETRTDALYFALSTLLTVGYGDVHAEGQLARGVVIGQMAFNIVVLATGFSFLANQLGARLRERRAGAPKSPPKSPGVGQ